ncbi:MULTISPECIES: hypothetical protein [Paenibacillus]|uniref:hypothetical protein n=1 Tax=Paenibacillus TaxID=44249 RepID=UPI0012B94BF3|nr:MULTISPECIES: hypothetical protein [Paenibacillus]
MKKILTVAVSIIMLFTFSSSIFASNSVKVQLSQDELKKITEYAENLGISDAVRDSLIEKIEAGGIPDSDNPEKKDTGVTEEYINSEKLKVKRIVFPDGSVIQSTFDATAATLEVVKPTAKPDMITPMIVDNGTGWVVSGSGYKKYYNALVKEETVFVKAKFYADYVLVNGGYDYISKVFDGFVDVAAGYASNQVQPYIVQQYQTYDSPAKATFSFTYVKYNGNFSTDYKLQLYVINDSPWSSLQSY